ncbi:MAG: toprim domain-containing protein [Holdemanella sp.]|nr:toprim domain-containing protein [Holdemanella sp.]
MLSQEDYKIIEQYIKQKNGKVETVPMNEKNGKLYPSSLKITLYRDNDITNTKRENELVFYIRQGGIDKKTNKEKVITMNQFLWEKKLKDTESYVLSHSVKSHADRVKIEDFFNDIIQYRTPEIGYLRSKIKDAVSIVDVINNYISVQKKGKNYEAVCPFHDDHDPSLKIDIEKQTFKCFVCGEGGDCVEFVKKYKEINEVAYKNKSNSEKICIAINEIIDTFNLDIEKIKEGSYDYQNENVDSSGRSYTEEEKRILKLLESFQSYALYEYENGEEGKEAQEYLLKRGVPLEVAKKLGYGIVSGQGAAKYLKAKGFTESEIIKSGLFKKGYGDLLFYNQSVQTRKADSQKNITSLYKGRLLIPIQNDKGKVISYCGRNIAQIEDAKLKEKADNNKYKNGDTTSVFKRSETLYNLNNAKGLATNNEVYVVEGFFDVAGGIKMGIENIVSTLGTETAVEQINQLKKLNCTVYLTRDNDQAGIKANIKNCEQLIKEHVDVRVVDLHELEKRCRNSNLQGDMKDLLDFSNLKDSQGRDKKIIEEHLKLVTKNPVEYTLQYKYFADCIHGNPVRPNKVTDYKLKKLTPELILNAYKSLQKDGYTEGVHAGWFLDFCKKNSEYSRMEIKNFVGIKDNDYEIEQMKLKIRELEEKNQSLKEENEQLKNELTKIKENNEVEKNGNTVPSTSKEEDSRKICFIMETDKDCVACKNMTIANGRNIHNYEFISCEQCNSLEEVQNMVKESHNKNIILAFNQNKEDSKSFGGRNAATKLQVLLREDNIDVAIHLPKSRGTWYQTYTEQFKKNPIKNEEKNTKNVEPYNIGTR